MSDRSVAQMKRLGPLQLSIDPLLHPHCPELDALPSSEEPSSRPPQLVLRYDESLNFSADYFVGKRALAFNRSSFAVYSERTAEFIVDHPFDSGQPLVLRLRPKPPRLRARLKVELGQRRCAEGTFLPNGIASYAILWGAAALALLKEHASFIHAAALQTKTGATLFVGSGGCGKTSTLLVALQRGGGKFLAEDFAIIDQQGFAHPCSKTITLYQSDIDASGFERANRLRPQGLGVLPSLRRKPANPKLKVRPDALFGEDQLGEKAPITAAIFLVRSNTTTFSIEPISSEALAERSSHASIRELKAWTEWLHMITANAPSDFRFPEPEGLRRRLASAHHAATRKAKCYLLRIPSKAPPAALVQFLETNGPNAGS